MIIPERRSRQSGEVRTTSPAGLTEPPVLGLLCFRWVQPIHISHGFVNGLVDVLDVYLVGVEGYPVHYGIRKRTFTFAYLVMPVLLLELRTEYGRRLPASLVDYLQEQPRLIFPQLEQKPFIDDQERGLGVFLQGVFKRTPILRGRQVYQKVGQPRELYGVEPLAGLHPEGACEICELLINCEITQTVVCKKKSFRKKYFLYLFSMYFIVGPADGISSKKAIYGDKKESLQNGYCN